jgi:Phage capsid family
VRCRHTSPPTTPSPSRPRNRGRDFSTAEATEVDRHLAMAKELKPRVLIAKADEKVIEKLRALGSDVGTPDTDHIDPATGRRHATDPRTGGLAATAASGGKAWSRTVARPSSEGRPRYRPEGIDHRQYRRAVHRVAWRRGSAAGSAPVLDLLINRTSVDTNTFEFLRQTARVNNAAAVPDGGLKPTSTFTVSAVEDRCRVLAHLSEVFPVRFLTDYDSLVTFLDSEMVEGVNQALETQALVGDGSGETLTGVMGTSGTVAVPYSTSLFATIRRARTAMELLGEVPTGWILHPSDLETVDLQTDSNGRLYLVGAGGDERINALFGDLPRVASSRIPQGTAILADWRKPACTSAKMSASTWTAAGFCSITTR